jgi:hypothetical protein
LIFQYMNRFSFLNQFVVAPRQVQPATSPKVLVEVAVEVPDMVIHFIVLIDSKKLQPLMPKKTESILTMTCNHVNQQPLMPIDFSK